MITGAYAVLETLKRLGVKDLFGYPGGAVIPIYNELYDFPDLNHVFVRHEQGAAHAADGYARVSGEIGVCLATSGPGATNLVTGIMTAQMDSIPLLAITGQVGSHLLGKDAFQETDIVGITMPITKHSFLITQIEEIPRLIKTAYEIAMSGRKGPVLVDIPRDIQLAQFPLKTFEAIFECETKYNPPQEKFEYLSGSESELQTLLKKAQRPVLIAGAGVVCANAQALLQTFVAHYDIPVVNTLLGLGSIPLDGKYGLGMIGMHGSVYGNFALRDADLVIAIGMRFDDRVTGNPDTFLKNARIIHIDIDRAEMNKNKRADISIITSAKEGLTYLVKQTSKSSHTQWIDQIQTWKRTYPLQPTQAPKHLTASQIIHFASRTTNDDAIVITDVGQHQMWAAQYYQFKKPRTFCSSGGAGTMGYGLPAALGAAIAKPDETVLLFVGDGGIQMTIQELMTLKQEKTNVKVIILNNGFLGMVRQWQELFNHKRYSSVDLSLNPDFNILADGYGLKNITVKSEADFIEFGKALRSDEAVLINCIIAREENVFPMIPAGLSVDEIVIGGEYDEKL